jgi:O-antigen/teichoic acid export membrane protein
MIIDLITSLILARLLTPHEVGIFSVSVAIISLAHTLRDFGISNYIVQERELTDQKIHTALGVTLTIAWSIAAVIYFLRMPVAVFYDESGMRDVLLLLAANFLIIPFSSVSFALLRRNMRFGSLFIINISSSLVSAITAITLGFCGFSYMSLAWAAFARIVTTIIVTFLVQPESAVWRPSVRGYPYVFSVGSRFSMASLMLEIGTSAPDLIIGRLFGFDRVGYFSRAQGIVALFQRLISQSIQTVALPYFSGEHRTGQAINEIYLKAFSYIMVVAWPLLSFLGIMAFPIIRTLYGPQWDAAAPIAEILCFAGAFACLSQLNYIVLVAVGGAHQAMVGQFINQSVKVLLMLISTIFGFKAVAISLVFSELFGFGTFYALLRPMIKLHPQNYVMPLAKSSAITLCTAIIPIVVLQTMTITEHPWLPLLIAALGSGCAWFSGLLLFRHPLFNEVTRFSRRERFGSKINKLQR